MQIVNGKIKSLTSNEKKQVKRVIRAQRSENFNDPNAVRKVIKEKCAREYIQNLKEVSYFD